MSVVNISTHPKYRNIGQQKAKRQQDKMYTFGLAYVQKTNPYRLPLSIV